MSGPDFVLLSTGPKGDPGSLTAADQAELSSAVTSAEAARDLALLSQTEAAVSADQAEDSVFDARRAGLSEGQFDEVLRTLFILSARVEFLETNQSEAQPMATYSFNQTLTGAAVQLIGDGELTGLAIQNRNGPGGSSIGIGFGTPPASINDAAFVIAPGDVGEAKAAEIPTAPVYLIGSGEVSGTYSLHVGVSNPNYYDDVEALITRMGGGVTENQRRAYRKLYTELRRLGLFEQMQGLFIFTGHSQAAALVNWAAAQNTASTAGTLTHAPGQGLTFNGSGYLNTELNIATFTGSSNLSAFVWPDATDQATGVATMGDGGVNVQANQTPTTASIKSGSGSGDTVESLPGQSIGFVRRNAARALIYADTRQNEIVDRPALSTLPSRNMIIGAANSSTGIGDFYTGTIRAAMFGKALSDVQIATADAAIRQFEIEMGG